MNNKNEEFVEVSRGSYLDAERLHHESREEIKQYLEKMRCLGADEISDGMEEEAADRHLSVEHVVDLARSSKNVNLVDVCNRNHMHNLVPFFAPRLTYTARDMDEALEYVSHATSNSQNTVGAVLLNSRKYSGLVLSPNAEHNNEVDRHRFSPAYWVWHDSHEYAPGKGALAQGVMSELPRLASYMYQYRAELDGPAYQRGTETTVYLFGTFDADELTLQRELVK